MNDDELNGKLDGIREQVKGIDKRLDGVDERIESIDDKIGDIRQRYPGDQEIVPKPECKELRSDLRSYIGLIRWVAYGACAIALSIGGLLFWALLNGGSL